MGKNRDIISLNRRAWNKVADTYNGRSYTIVGDLFTEFLNSVIPAGRVLDVGSGTGEPYARMLVDAGFDVLGIDVAPRMVEIARERVSEAEFIELSMTDMEFLEEFDGVIAVFTLLLLDPPRFPDVAGRVKNSLKRDGMFLPQNLPICYPKRWNEPRRHSQKVVNLGKYKCLKNITGMLKRSLWVIQ